MLCDLVGWKEVLGWIAFLQVVLLLQLFEKYEHVLYFYPKGSLDACTAEQEKLEDSDASDNESIVNSNEHKKRKITVEKSESSA